MDGDGPLIPETVSVARAASALERTQTALSHDLARLHPQFSEPLSNGGTLSRDWTRSYDDAQLD